MSATVGPESSSEVRIPLHPVQAALLNSIGPNPELYCQGLHARLPATTEPRALSRVIQSVLNRHDAFKLYFDRHPEGWQQHKKNGRIIAPMELRQLPAGAITSAFIRDQWQRLSQRLSLTKAPLIRFCLIQESNGPYAHLLIVAHPLIFDTPSWRILVDELEKSYRFFSDRTPATLPKVRDAWQMWCEKVFWRSGGFLNPSSYRGKRKGFSNNDRSRKNPPTSSVLQKYRRPLATAFFDGGFVLRLSSVYPCNNAFAACGVPDRADFACDRVFFFVFVLQNFYPEGPTRRVSFVRSSFSKFYKQPRVSPL